MEIRHNVFVSSTYKDLIKERKKVKETILHLDCFPIGMELFLASDNTQWEEIKKEINRSDVYIVIVAGRYGSVDDNGRGFTEKEYDYAVSKGIPVLAFLHKEISQLPGSKLESTEEGKKKLELFRKKIEANKHCNYWKNGDRLTTRVTASLAKQISKLEAKKVDAVPSKGTDANSAPPDIDVVPIAQVTETSTISSESPSKSIRATPPSPPIKQTVQNQNFTRRNNHFPQYFIDDLKNRADIVRIIQPYAQDLKKKGANWMACCPFHQEKTPSFSVNPAKGFYKCFGCGKGGSAFNFIMEMEGLNFPEAIKRVAEISGVMLPEPVDDVSYERTKKKREETKKLADQVIELNQMAVEFWEAELQGKSKKAKEAREYLAKRGISDEIQKQFHIGFSPDSWDGLLTVLREKNIDEKLIEQSGLVSVNEEKERVFDRFRGRIMFPVLDVNGRPVAFGARALSPDDQPKYLNSPETAAYTKSEHLYGLFQAKDEIRKKKFAILVEGYLDLIALAQFGVKNVAASLGTAFTDQQSKLLSRFAKSVVINYDGDAAGIKAARRAIEHLLPQEFDIKVLVLPDGKDPDDFIRENGVAAYNESRGKATPFLRFALEASTTGRNLNNAKQKAEAIEDFLPVISAIRNNIQRRESFDQAMTFFHIEDVGLRRELWSTLKTASANDTEYVTQRISRAARAKITLAERKLLELLVFDHELREIVLPQLEPSDYENLSSGELFDAFIEIHNSGKEITPESLLEHIGDDENSLDLAHELLQGKARREKDDVLDTVLHEAENCVFSLRNMAIANRIIEISREAAIAEQTGDGELFNQLTYEQLELEKIRRELQRKVADL
ncbi:MAG TPA: DNA primase [Pyrinomonadaceae bacterium]|nr:DNA primase [Pyrinomonadaceae bacterium]